jgi:2,3-bisphosphoglycerate-independent phosphoglycerate mutase
VLHGQAVEASGFFVYGDSGTASSVETTRRFIEADAQASTVPSRDATKFVMRLFAKGS